MRSVWIAFIAAAALAGCSSHHERMSGSSTPPATQNAQAMPAQTGKMDWKDCEAHPYVPGPKKCE